MLAEAQDIVIIRNLRFKSNNEMDWRVDGRPAIIIHKDDEYFYYLIISKPTTKDEPGYFLLKKDKYNRLKQDTYVNVKEIYKEKLQDKEIIGRISNVSFMQLYKTLKNYQSKAVQDENYHLIKHK